MDVHEEQAVVDTDEEFKLFMQITTQSEEQSPVDVDSEFAAILQESEAQSLEGMRLVDKLSAESEDKALEDKAQEEEVRVEMTLEEVRSFSKQFNSSSIDKARKQDKRDARGRWFAAGLCVLDKPACESKAARLVFEKRGPKPRWAVEACVLLRAQGKCEVCEEQLHGPWDVKLVVPIRKRGEWVESNCLCVCSHCAKCWFTQKDFYTGHGSASVLQRLSVAVMQRRQRSFRDCKMLSTEAWERFVELEKREQERLLRERAVMLEVARRAREEQQTVH